VATSVFETRGPRARTPRARARGRLGELSWAATSSGGRVNSAISGGVIEGASGALPLYHPHAVYRVVRRATLSKKRLARAQRGADLAVKVVGGKDQHSWRP
jgi:hypothetical protein